MVQFLHIIMMLPIVILNFYIIRILRKKSEILSPYTFFYIMISIEFVGPLVYYLIFNGQSYRFFSEEALLLYYIIAFFSFCVFIIQIKAKKRASFKHLEFKKKGYEKKLFYLYMVLVLTTIILYLIKYRNQLLLLNILQGSNEDLVRSDTSGLIPHWYTISSFISLIIPSFYFYFSAKIKNESVKFILFFVIAFLTIIDGNKGLFIYLVLFMFLYVYKFKVNRYTIAGTGAAFFFYYLLKAGNISRIGIIFESAARRFFVTQGACFINRIEMSLNGYDFSQSSRISTDVFQHMYRYSGGAAPTVFWGDIYVKYGMIILLLSIVISNWILYRFSNFIVRDYKNNMFMYWSYASVAYMLCMSELSFDHILRFLMILINCVIFLATVGKRNQNDFE